MLYIRHFSLLPLAAALFFGSGELGAQTTDSQRTPAAPNLGEAQHEGGRKPSGKPESTGTPELPKSTTKPQGHDEFGKRIAISKADRKLHSAVARALVKAQGVDASNVEVQARGGKVILHGSVPEDEQRLRAGEVASGTPGVTSVENALTVRPVGN